MKNIKYLLSLLTVVLIMSSCATTQGITDDEYADDRRTQQVGNRVYLQDPYNGTVVLERDPFTGRYYDVTYGPRYGGGGYYRYPSANRVYRTTPRGGSVGGGKIIQQNRPTQQQIQQDRAEARKKILGN